MITFRRKLFITGAVAVFSATQIFATNGANLIGLTPASTGQGGVGIAFDTGVESILKNPALLTVGDVPVLTVGGNFVALDSTARISYEGTPLTADTGKVKNAADSFVIPEFGFTTPINESFSTGIGVFGTAGFGADFRNKTEGFGILSNMRSHLMVLKIAPALGYKHDKLRLGVSSHISYGLLNFAAHMPDTTGSFSTIQQRSGGLSDGVQVGFQGGASYDVSDYVRLGATYQTPVKFNFKNAFDFDRNGTYDSIKFDLPAELGVGISVGPETLKFSFDAKQIYWSQAQGFKQLNWNDQTVLSLGVQHQTTKKLILRAGYNYAPSVLGDTSSLSALNGTSQFGTGEFYDSNLAFFNVVGLGPAIGEQTITAGLEYAFTPKLSFGASVAYGLSNTVKQSGLTSLASGNDTEATYETEASTVISTFALTRKF